MHRLATLILSLFITQAVAMSDTAQVVTAGTAQGLVNAGVAIYMQGQGMNPQFANSPTGPYVVPGNAVSNQNNTQNTPGHAYTQQNNQAQKQSFFNGS